MRGMALLIVVLLAVLPARHASAYDPCGELENGYGPYDYRTDKDKLKIVETYHFNAYVEALERPITATLGGDIDYTLRAFPNHFRALISMVNLGLKLKLDKPPGANWPVSCYLERAQRFRPRDPMVRVVTAHYMSRHGKKNEAVRELETAKELGATGANLDYNMGLAYLEVGEFTKALESAHRAYGAGFNLPGLKSRLVKAGKWREPSPAAEAAPAVAVPVPSPAVGATEAK